VACSICFPACTGCSSLISPVSLPSHATGGERGDVTGHCTPPLQHGVDLGAWYTERGAQLVVDAERKRQRTVRIERDGEASAQLDEDGVSCGGTAADGRILLLTVACDVRQLLRHLFRCNLRLASCSKFALDGLSAEQRHSVMRSISRRVSRSFVRS